MALDIRHKPRNPLSMGADGRHSNTSILDIYELDERAGVQILVAKRPTVHV